MSIRICKLSWLSILMALAPAIMFAQSNDVIVRMNGGSSDSNKVFIGRTNRLEILIKNSSSLYGLDMSYSVTSSAPFSWVRPYGTRPTSSPVIALHGSAASVFNLENEFFVWDRLNDTSPDSIGFAGVSDHSSSIPTSLTTYALCFSLQFSVPSSASPATGGFCIDNIYPPSWPTGYEWMFVTTGSAGVVPAFMGNTNASSTNPSAPQVCFDIVKPDGGRGDVNCDGLVTISDAVYILNYVFAGGQPPCPF